MQESGNKGKPPARALEDVGDECADSVRGDQGRSRASERRRGPGSARCRCGDADLHRLVTWPRIGFYSSSDVDQTRCAFGKPVGQISYIFKWDVLILAVAGKRMQARVQPTGISQGFFAEYNLQRLKGFSSGERPACKYHISNVWWLVPSLFFWKGRKGKEPCLKSRPFLLWAKPVKGPYRGLESNRD